jgi:hypothetical protein
LWAVRPAITSRGALREVCLERGAGGRFDEGGRESATNRCGPRQACAAREESDLSHDNLVKESV